MSWIFWIILIAPILIGLLVIRWTYKVEKRRLEKDKKESAAQMKAFMDMLQKGKNEN